MAEPDSSDLLKPKPGRKRFVRFVLLLTGLLLLMAGIGFLNTSRHSAAEVALHNIGVESIDRFEDPPGPNWWYTGGDFLPGGGYFPAWFADYFCLQGDTIYFVAELSMNATELEWFTDLIHLKSLSIRESEVPDRWVQTISQCRDLESLQITRIVFGAEDVRDLASLRLRTLNLNYLDLRAHQKTLLDSISQIEGLQEVSLVNTNLPMAAKQQLQELLPDCSVKFVTSNAGLILQ